MFQINKIMYYLLGFYFFLLGAIFASFFSCLAWRLSREESAWPSSRCDHCQRLLRWFENVPVLGYLLLGGRCSSCHQKINWQYFVAEIFGGFLFLLAFILFFKNSSFFLTDWLLADDLFKFLVQLFTLLILFFVMIYDGRYYLVSLPMVFSASVVLYFINLFFGIQWFVPLIAAIIGGGFFWLQYLLTRGKGIGEGDIYLGILFGFIFPNYLNLLTAIIISYFIGAIVGLTLIVLRKKKLSSALPLGFFLALGGMITILFGNQLINWYFGWL